MLLRYFVNDSEMIPSAPSINGITLFRHVYVLGLGVH